MRTKSYRTLAAVGVVGVLAAGALPALAQDATDETTGDTTAAEPADEPTPRGERRAQREGAFAAALAEELGLDADRVAAAVAAVREDLLAERRAEHREVLEERLAAAVEAGTMTQEQADALLAAHDAGILPGRGLGGPDGRHGPRGPRFGGPGAPHENA